MSNISVFVMTNVLCNAMTIFFSELLLKHTVAHKNECTPGIMSSICRLFLTDVDDQYQTLMHSFFYTILKKCCTIRENLVHYMV